MPVGDRRRRAAAPPATTSGSFLTASTPLTWLLASREVGDLIPLDLAGSGRRRLSSRGCRGLSKGGDRALVGRRRRRTCCPASDIAAVTLRALAITTTSSRATALPITSAREWCDVTFEYDGGAGAGHVTGFDPYIQSPRPECVRGTLDREARAAGRCAGREPSGRREGSAVAFLALPRCTLRHGTAAHGCRSRTLRRVLRQGVDERGERRPHGSRRQSAGASTDSAAQPVESRSCRKVSIACATRSATASRASGSLSTAASASFVRKRISVEDGRHLHLAGHEELAEAGRVVYRRVLLRAATHRVVAVVFETLHGGVEHELRQAGALRPILVLSAVPYLRAGLRRMRRAVVVDGDEDVAINGRRRDERGSSGRRR